MKKVLICALAIIIATIGLAAGEIIGFQAGRSRYYYAEPPEGPYDWYYLGTVVESKEENTGEFAITVQLSDNFNNTTRTFRITSQTDVIGEVNPIDLLPGDRVEFFVKTYHHIPEVICELFCAEFVDE